jgi:NAD(P)H-nitrite reductase large subunit
MQTSDKAVFAIGDCAEREMRPSGLWSVGVAQARIAAAAILESSMPPGELHPPLLQLKSKGIDLISYGDPMAHEPGDEVLSSPAFSGTAWRLVIRDGRIVGASFAGPPSSLGQLKSRLRAEALTASVIDDLRASRIEALTGPVERRLDHAAGSR